MIEAALVAAGVLVWLACGYIVAAASLAYFQREYPFIARAEVKSDWRFGLVMGCFGPFTLVSGFWVTGWFKHGFIWSWPRYRPSNVLDGERDKGLTL